LHNHSPTTRAEHITDLASAVLTADHPKLYGPDQPLRVGMDNYRTSA
jgi:hypothetical protein